MFRKTALGLAAAAALGGANYAAIGPAYADKSPAEYRDEYNKALQQQMDSLAKDRDEFLAGNWYGTFTSRNDKDILEIKFLFSLAGLEVTGKGQGRITLGATFQEYQEVSIHYNRHMAPSAFDVEVTGYGGRDDLRLKFEGTDSCGTYRADTRNKSGFNDGSVAAREWHPIQWFTYDINVALKEGAKRSEVISPIRETSIELHFGIPPMGILTVFSGRSRPEVTLHAEPNEAAAVVGHVPLAARLAYSKFEKVPSGKIWFYVEPRGATPGWISGEDITPTRFPPLPPEGPPVDLKAKTGTKFPREEARITCAARG